MFFTASFYSLTCLEWYTSLLSATVLILSHRTFGEVLKGKKGRRPYLDISITNKDQTQHGDIKAVSYALNLTPSFKELFLGLRRQGL